MTLLLLLACVERPEGPPPPPDQPASVDTGDWGDPDAPLSEGGANRPPVIEKLDLMPESLLTTTPARAVFEVRDPEGRLVTSNLTWLVNGERVPGETLNYLHSGAFKRGDRVQVQLTVSDGPNEVRFESIERLVENSPPAIEVPKGGLSGNIDGFRLTATDPDDDRLSWSIVNGPPGLEIGADGVIHYAPQPIEGEGRTYEAEVRVEDPSGEWASWPLVLDLRPGKERTQVPQ